jgi:hypothetical protein
MTTHLKSVSRATLRGNYVLLTADTLSLLLPQHEVGNADYLDGELEAADEHGLFKVHNSVYNRRYAALSAQMTLLPNFPPERFLATTIGDHNMDIFWCWNELRIMIGVDLQLKSIPKVLLSPRTPVNQYVEFEDKLAYLCSAKQLCEFARDGRSW